MQLLHLNRPSTHVLPFVDVSCDPATQARDTAIILKEGYRISEVKIFDLFPQTRHIERWAGEEWIVQLIYVYN